MDESMDPSRLVRLVQAGVGVIVWMLFFLQHSPGIFIDYSKYIIIYWRSFLIHKF